MNFPARSNDVPTPGATSRPGCRPVTRLGAALLGIVGFLVTPASGLATPVPIGNVVTYAGGSVGDGRQATDAISAAEATATDGAGNVYLADFSKSLVRKITPDGVIHAFAGNQSFGYAGDGGPATAATLAYPRALAVDAAGNVFISEEGNGRVRKVDSAGMISTFAGGNTYGPLGDGGPATSANLSSPAQIAFDTAGNLFIVDRGHSRVRKVAPSGTISTVAGNGTAGYGGDGGQATSAMLNYPYGVAVDGAGVIYIGDTENNRVRKVQPSGVISTIAGNSTAGASGDGGPAALALLNNPWHLSLDGAGDLAIADSRNGRIRVVVPSGTIDTVAGTTANRNNPVNGQPATSMYIGFTTEGLYERNGDMLIPVPNASVVVRIHSGLVTIIAGNLTCCFLGDGGQAAQTSLGAPRTGAVDAAGNLYIADTNNGRIRRVDVNGVITTVAGHDCGSYYGAYSGDGGPATAACLSLPQGVAVDAAGNIYIADTYNGRIRRVDTAGKITTIAGRGGWGYSGDGGPATDALLNGPWSVALDGAGNLLVAEYLGARVRQVSPTGTISTFAGTGINGFSGDGGAATLAQLNNPSEVAVNNGSVYITDRFNQRIRKVTAGVISTYVGSGAQGWPTSSDTPTTVKFQFPWGLSFDAAGTLYIADTGNAVIRTVARDGSMATVAGSYSNYGICSGFSGDGGPATSACFNQPEGVTVTNGGIYISDTNNNRVRFVALNIQAGPVPNAPPSATPLSITANAISPTEGSEFSGTVAQVTGGTAPYTASIAWGDAASSPGAVAASGAVTGTHTYDDCTGCTLAVTVTDSTGATVTGTAAFSVADAPVRVIAVNPTITEGSTAALAVAHFSDGNSLAVIGDYTSQATWVNGQVATTTIQASPGGGYDVFATPPTDVSGVVEEGTFTASVVIRDEGQAVATVNPTLTVTDAPLQMTTAGPYATGRARTFSTVLASINDTNVQTSLRDLRASMTFSSPRIATFTINCDGTVDPNSGYSCQVSGPNPYQLTLSGPRPRGRTVYQIDIKVVDDGGQTATGNTTLSR
ncbi:MAG: hypothetical protein NVS3B24_11670 [Candidatus Dormibacteria bacterium]